MSRLSWRRFQVSKKQLPLHFLLWTKVQALTRPGVKVSACERQHFTKVPCLFHSPTCTWVGTKLEARLTCLWFGSQLGITFSAPQAKPRILLAKYYWCPGATSWKSCLQYPRAWQVGFARLSPGNQDIQQEKITSTLSPTKFHKSLAYSLHNTIHVQENLSNTN